MIPGEGPPPHRTPTPYLPRDPIRTGRILTGRSVNPNHSIRPFDPMQMHQPISMIVADGEQVVSQPFVSTAIASPQFLGLLDAGTGVEMVVASVPSSEQ